MTSSGAPDYWLSTGGQTSPASLKERRSTILNDPEIEDGTTPPASYTATTYKGKFYPRGCRGIIEQLQIYCKRTGSGDIELRYSPHPSLGPIGTVTVTPGSSWAWKSATIEKMWSYDSLFIWVYTCDSDVSWGYDAVSPPDGHSSDDSGVTWEDVTERPFIRAVLTGETPGDVPVSGVINNIPIPGVSTLGEWVYAVVEEDVETTLVDIHGAGYVDTIQFTIGANPDSDDTSLRVYCDESKVFDNDPDGWEAYGYTASTPHFSLTSYTADGYCHMLLTRRFDFRQRLRITALNNYGQVSVLLRVYPTLLG